MTEAGSPAQRDSSCPVCGLPGIDGAATVCPQCDADLRCFHALELLARAPAPAPQPAPSRSAAATRALGAAGAALAILLGAQLLLLLRPISRPAVPPRTASASLSACDRPREARPAQAAAAARRTAPASRETVAARAARGEHRPRRATTNPPRYDARPEDNLWLIAARFYGRGDCYPLLLEDNPGASAGGIGAGVRLRLIADRAAAARRCRALIHRDQRGRFWYYALRRGDSPASVARRCLGAAAQAPRVARLNAGVPWSAGQKIRLYLP
jgi:hypothetical protein